VLFFFNTLPDVRLQVAPWIKAFCHGTPLAEILAENRKTVTVRLFNPKF
jgi:hypothetical protein